MSANWASVAVAGLVALGLFLGWWRKSARREGKVDALLARLTEIGEDHEDRIRDLERTRITTTTVTLPTTGRPRPRRSPQT